MTNLIGRRQLSISWRTYVLLVGLCCFFPVISSYAADSITEVQQNKTKKFRGNVLDEAGAPVNPEKPDVPLNKNDAFQKVQKRRVQEKR